MHTIQTGFLEQIILTPTMAQMSFSALITHVPPRPLQIVLSFLEFGNVLPKEHRKDSLPGGCPTDDQRKELDEGRIRFADPV
jgi:hypothetical protein